MRARQLWVRTDSEMYASAALGPVALAAHTIVKQVTDFAMAIFGCFSTVAQSLVATCLGKVMLRCFSGHCS